MNPLLTSYNKILEGCGKYNSGIVCGEYFNSEGLQEGNSVNFKSDFYDKRFLCPSCSKAKEVFLQRCQSEFDRLEINFKGIDLEQFDKTNGTNLVEWIEQLKEVLQKDG